MKRAILILAGIIAVLILLNQFWMTSSSGGKANAVSQTNVAVSRPVLHLHRATSPQPFASTNLVTNDEEENGWKKLSRDQIEAYLLKTKRSPESLLNAFLETRDTISSRKLPKNILTIHSCNGR